MQEVRNAVTRQASIRGIRCRVLPVPFCLLHFITPPHHTALLKEMKEMSEREEERNRGRRGRSSTGSGSSPSNLLLLRLLLCVCVWDSGWKNDCSREYVNVCVKARWKEPCEMGKRCRGVSGCCVKNSHLVWYDWKNVNRHVVHVGSRRVKVRRNERGRRVVGQQKCPFTRCLGADRSRTCPLHSSPCPFSASSSACGQRVTLPSSQPQPP